MTKKFTISNEVFTAHFEMSGDEKKPQPWGRFQTLIYLALSDPHQVFWDGDWWIECISKEYHEQMFPTHRPVWMTKGEWETLRDTIKDYRIAFALDEKPVTMSDEDWNRIYEVKQRHGLLPVTKENLSMDELEDILDLQAELELEMLQEEAAWRRAELTGRL